MARRVFFSFHYQNDIWRVSQVRNSWLLHDGETNTFMDSASWESVKKQGVSAIKSWIDRQLKGTGVTVVLVGSQTAERRYVRYEIEESYKKGNGLLVVFIHNQ
ncbi:MAG TPA: TIR domain-containing protein [Verrucomicrobiae bacterium]